MNDDNLIYTPYTSIFCVHQICPVCFPSTYDYERTSWDCVRSPPPTDSPVEEVAEEDMAPVADEGSAGKILPVNGPRVSSRVRKPSVCVCGPEWLRQ